MLSEVHIPKAAVLVGDPGMTSVTYPDLTKALAREWEQQKAHSDPSDRKQDQVVLHSDNRTPFKELVAVLDAIAARKRDLKMPDGRVAKISVFNPTFAVR